MTATMTQAAASLSIRPPPQNLEAEASVLGAIFLDPVEAGWLAADVVKPEHFHRPANGKIFEACLRLLGGNRPVDVVTVASELRNDGLLESVGGSVYLGEIIEAAPSAANVAYYAGLVRDAAILRAVARIGAQMQRDVYDGAPANQIAERAEERLMEIVSAKATGRAFSIGELLEEEVRRLEKNEPPRGVMSSMTDLDRLTGGFRPGELIVLAARPGMGKSSLACSIMLELAVRNVPTVIYSLEMSKSQMTQNILGQYARVSMHLVRDGQASKDEVRMLMKKARELTALPLLVDEGGRETVTQLRSKARVVRVKHKAELVVIDYLQLVSGTGKEDNREQEVASVSRGLKQMAKELDVPVLVLAQLNRAVETRAKHKPMLSDLRESGSVEQDADIVLLLYREGYYEPDKPELASDAEVIVAKNRNGPTGSAKLYFSRECMRFGSTKETWR